MSLSILIMNKIFNLTIFLCALMQFNFCWGQEAKQKYRILTSGYFTSDMKIVQDIVGARWSIEVLNVGSCTPSRAQTDSINQHNKIIFPLITKRYGEGWAEKFAKEIEVEHENQLNVRFILDETDFITSKERELEKKGIKGFLYFMRSVKNNLEYNVSVVTLDELDGKKDWVSYYRLLVDLKTKKVKVLSDELVRDELHMDY